MQAIIIFLEFYFEYMQLMQTYSTRRPTTFLVKNVRSATHGGQQLLTNDALIFVILVVDAIFALWLATIHES
jgi:hypothetical protein